MRLKKDFNLFKNTQKKFCQKKNLNTGKKLLLNKTYWVMVKKRFHKFASVEEVGSYILAERAKKPQELQNVLTTALKVDKDANMGLISDIKQELRKVNALKVNYTTYEGDAFRNPQ